MNVENKNFVTGSQACKFFKVSPNTLRSWDAKGYITTIRTNNINGHRRYDINSFKQFDQTEEDNNCKRKIETIKNSKISVCYCRVSSKHQSNDLENQIKFMQDKYPKHEIVKDIGSGINFKRPGFLKLIERAINGEINEIVVAYKDRLCRFGFDFFKWLFDSYKIKFVVLNESNAAPEDELCKDVLSIIHVFSCKINGSRKYKNIKKEKSKKGDTSDTSIKSM